MLQVLRRHQDVAAECSGKTLCCLVEAAALPADTVHPIALLRVTTTVFFIECEHGTGDGLWMARAALAVGQCSEWYHRQFVPPRSLSSPRCVIGVSCTVAQKLPRVLHGLLVWRLSQRQGCDEAHHDMDRCAVQADFGPSHASRLHASRSSGADATLNATRRDVVSGTDSASAEFSAVVQYLV